MKHEPPVGEHNPFDRRESATRPDGTHDHLLYQRMSDGGFSLMHQVPQYIAEAERRLELGSNEEHTHDVAKQIGALGALGLLGLGVAVAWRRSKEG